MKAPRLLYLLVGFALGAACSHLFAQDSGLQGSYGAAPAATPGPAGGPPPTVAPVPTAPDSPGREGQIALDERYLYTCHRGVWRRSARANLD